MSTAEKIAERFGHDGTRWTDEHGIGLHLVLFLYCAASERSDDGRVERHVLRDGSAILVTESWWDVEAPGRPFAYQSCAQESSI